MKIFFILLTFGFSSFSLGADLSGHDIMVKNDEVRQLENCVAHAKFTTKNEGGGERVKEFTWWRQLTGDKVHYNTLTRFHFPPEVKGEGILFLEHDKSQNDIQIYLPSFKKIRRVEADQQSGSFMGSEFSYSDIAAPHVDDFSYKVLREEKCPKENDLCYVISETPTDEVKERTGSSGGTLWVHKGNFMLARGEYLDLESKPWKNLETGEIKEVDPVKHKWMAFKLKMDNLKTKSFTSLVFDQVKVSDVIPPSTFTNQNLAKER